MVPDTHGLEDQPVWYMANLDVCMALHFSWRKIRPNSLICPNPSYHLGWKVGARWFRLTRLFTDIHQSC